MVDMVNFKYCVYGSDVDCDYWFIEVWFDIVNY